MPSTYSSSLKLELIATGEKPGTWGVITNTNLGTLLEQAITGVQNITMVNADYTLSNLNGLADESRNAVLVIGGTNSAVRNVIAPSVNKTYIIKNATVGGYSIVIKTASGLGITVPNGNTTTVYCNGTDFFNAVTITKESLGVITSATGSEIIPVGTTVQRDSPALAGYFRFNSTNDWFEGYNGTNWGLLGAATAITGSEVIPVGTTAERDATPLTGYFRFNSTFGTFEGYNGTSWGSVGGGATGAGGDQIFVENGQNVTTSYTIPATKNAMTTGPITVDAGVTVTVSGGSRWVVL
jgi:hypothetical protein